MISYDLTYSFSHIELYPSAKRPIGFRWRGKLYVYNVLSVGLRRPSYVLAKTVSVLVAR
jgi:hypothetical protein